ncbi:carbohydrate-binding protein [Paenibacillus alkalitolerans]|uniref:carbohydrate-binding protein n=1 Tax=Paenibacillus alkalitolerans TaxID=2799335 RepID=UPI0018F7BD34|nr:carbohydrate-binding protein [Paenibacillus alkalitolerans]
MGKWSKFYRGRLLLFLALIMLAPSIPAEGVSAADTLLKTGNYYYLPTADGGSLPDKGAADLVSASEGVLFDGLTSTYAGWMGSATSKGTVQVVFDLLKDYPLDRIRVVLNSPNRFWGFKEFTMKYRSEAVPDYYYIATKHVREGTDLNYSVTVPMSNKSARFIVIDIKRSHAYQHIPLTELEIYRGIGDEGQNPGPALTAAEMREEMKKDGMMVDKYGQWIYETWPGKVTSDEQLRQEYADEAQALADVSLDLTKYDSYGGIKSGGKFAGTGYFRVQQIDGKWWFITPAGYKFFLKGVDATSLWEWGYGTPLKKEDGTPRRVFEELPDPVEFAPAYASDSDGNVIGCPVPGDGIDRGSVSFVIANVMKKYGSDYEAKWEDITKKRLIDWGFNAFSKWTRPINIEFPYIHLLQDSRCLKKILWTYDVFDPQNESIIEDFLSPQLKKAKNDPWLIGYTYDNEAGWTSDIVREVLTYNSTSPAKSAFVDFLAPRYNNDLAAVNQLLGTNAASFAELKDIPINIAKVPAVDVSEYIRLASRTYFTTVTKVIRKYDTNHLFLGVSVVPTWRTSLDWDQAAMEFVDAFSVDNYTNDPSWISRYEAYGKPLLNLEYSFGTSERGLSPVNAATKMKNAAERGTAFQSFVEGQAAHPLFVGSGWFTYYDQAVPGRRDGENFNIGLLNQQDQPYTDMVNIMKTVNEGLENVHQDSSPVMRPDPVPIRIEAEKYSSQIGIITETASDTGGGQNIGSLDPGDWVAYSGINLTGMDNMSFRYASIRTGTMRVRLGSPSGTIIGTLDITPTGGWQNWTTKNIAIAPTVGFQNIYFTFERDDGQTVANLNYFEIPETNEAENAVLSGAVAANHYSGYTGTGYADYVNANGDYVEWTVNASAAGTYALTFRYANGGSGDRPLKITVNGSVVNSGLSFPPTGGWSTWSTVSINASLNTGTNTVRATAIGSSGGNVDSLTVKRFDLTPPRISIGGVEDGQSYTESVVPVVTADDAESGVKSLTMKLNGEDWTAGTAITAKGEHTLTVTATDNAGHTSTKTIRFTLYHGTQLQVEPASGVYSDTTVLNAELKDSSGQPVSGGTVTFAVAGTIVGTAVTDEQGKASLDYTVTVGAAPNADTLSHDVHAVFAQNDASYLRGSEGSSILTAGKEEADIAYTGSTVVSSSAELALAARVTQQDDGEQGSLAQLPVRFILNRIHTDGTATSVTEAVYGTDETGSVSASVPLPAGLYEIKSELMPNGYYKTAENTVVAAVYDPGTGMRIDGWLEIPPGSGEFGDNAKKLIIETEWQHGKNGLLQGNLTLLSEPQGLRLEAQSAEWMVVTEDSYVYLQAVAQDDNGEMYTVRIMAPAASPEGGNPQTTVSVTIWKGMQTNGTALFQVFGQTFYGFVLET